MLYHYGGLRRVADINGDQLLRVIAGEKSIDKVTGCDKIARNLTQRANQRRLRGLADIIDQHLIADPHISHARPHSNRRWPVSQHFALPEQARRSRITDVNRGEARPNAKIDDTPVNGNRIERTAHLLHDLEREFILRRWLRRSRHGTDG